MNWLKFFRKDAAKPAPSVVNRPAAAGRVRTKVDPVAGYGANPYDTYTWELHTDPDGERELKRAHRIDRQNDEGETFNPYDTSKFSGGW